MKWLARDSQRGAAAEARGRDGDAAEGRPGRAGEREADLFTEVSEAALQQLLGNDWRRQRHQVLDFSSPLFCLEKLTSADGGLLHPQLRVDYVTELNLSDNALGRSGSGSGEAAGDETGRETAGARAAGRRRRGGQQPDTDAVSDVISAANGFTRLKKLTLTRNLLEEVNFHLPALQELRLDFNRLRRMPPLDGIRNIEVLTLAHNEISDWWHGIEACPKLREVDLAYNKMDFPPSEAVAHLKYFSALTNLQRVRLEHNMFSSLFPEYAALLVHYLVAAGNTQLRMLDGEPVTAQGRDAALQQSASVYSRLHQYDEAYLYRREFLQARPDTAFHATVEESGRSAAVLQMNRLLEAALQQKPGKAVNEAARFFDLCGQVYTADSEQELQELWVGVENSDKVRRALVKQVVQNALVLIQRDERVRHLVTRGLAKLCVVKEGNMGVECLRGLSMLLQQFEDGTDEGAAEVLSEIVVPALRAKADDEHLALAIVNGIASMTPSVQLAAALSDCVALLSDMLQIYSAYESIYRVVHIACMLPENCLEATGQGIPQSVTQTLLQTELPTDDTGRQLYCDMCAIVGRCAWHVPKAALYMGKARLHVDVLLFYMRDLIGERQETRRLTVVQAKLCYSLMLTLIGMMHGDPQVMHECCDQYHVIDLFLPAVKEAAANPLVLAASATGVRAVLENEEQRRKVLQYVIEEIQMLSPLLQYIGGSRYGSLCHQAAFLESNQDSLSFTPDVPPLSELQNEYVLKAITAIAKLAAFFLQHDEDHYCLGISDALCEAHGEQTLLRLLQVRDGNVRLACMQCISKVAAKYLTKETLHTIVQLLPSLHRPDHSNNSVILRLAVELLTRVVSDESSVAYVHFVESYADAAVREVFSVLSRNVTLRSSSRRKEVEANREKLSLACVNFMRKASCREALRPSLRAADVCQFLAPLLKAEEEQLRFIPPDAYEIAVERSWTGRDVKSHALSLSGVDRLDARMKVAFRSISRIADVLEGKPDLFDAKEEILTLEPLCKAERKMWDEGEMWRNLLYLDEMERNDRAVQQAEFVRLAAAERLLLFLMPLANPATPRRYAEQRREKKDAEYWAGRLKADTEDMAEEILRRAHRKAELAETAKDNRLAKGDASQAGRRRPQPQSRWPKGGRGKAAGQHRGEGEAEDEEDDEAEEDPALQHLQQDNTEPLRGRERLMEVLMKTEFHVDPETAAIHLQGGSELYGPEGLWKNVENAELNNTFIISAFLRCLYACVFGATSAAVRADIVRSLRRPAFLRKLVALVEACPALSCHTAAKFLRLMKLALQMEPTQSAESMDLVVIYTIVTDWALQMIRSLLFILKHASRRPLNAEEQILSAELASFHALLARQTGYIKFSLEFEAQRWAVERALERLFPPTALQAFVAMLLFDMQIDAGTPHGSYISHLFADLAPARERMRVDCFSILAAVVQHCPKSLSYEAMEALHYARVFLHFPLRRSALYDLLDDINLGNFCGTVELLLSEHSQRAERVLQIAVVRWWNQEKHTKTSEPVRQIVAATNYAFYVLEKPPGIRDPQAPQLEYSHRKGGRIRVDEQKSYRTITRLVKGFPAAGWLAVGWRLSDGARKAREVFDILLCDKMLLAEPLLECLRLISGPTEDDRVEVLKDVVMKRCLADIVAEEEMQETLWALVQPPAEEDGKKSKASPYVALVVLSLTHYYEILVDWRYWFCLDPLERQEAGALEEDYEEAADKAAGIARPRRNEGLVNFVGWMDEEQSAWGADNEIKMLREQAIKSSSSEMPAWMGGQGGEGGGAAVVPSTAMDTIHYRRMQLARGHILSQKAKLDVGKIREVEFGGGEECTVEMTFGKRTEKKVPKVVRLTFFDDTARERWRRALAKALNRSDTSDQWMRFWKS